MDDNHSVVGTVGVLVAFEVVFVLLLPSEDNDDTLVMEVAWLDPRTLSVDVSLVDVLLGETCDILAILSFKAVIGTDFLVFFRNNRVEI